MAQSTIERREARGGGWMARQAALFATVLLVAHAALGQDVGTVADLAGSAQLGRAGSWMPLAIGAALQQGDTLRTATPGRVRLVFQDNSVLTLGDGSEVRIDEQTVDGTRGVARSLFRLLEGKLRVLVGEYYERPKSRFKIETVTAVAGVRGTEFVISFDPIANTSDVVGVSGRVEVHSVLDRVGHVVFITAQEATTVVRGKYPTPPRRLDDDLFRQTLEKLAFVGPTTVGSVTFAQPLATGNVVPEPDRVTAMPIGSVATAEPHAAVPAPINKAPVLSEEISGKDRTASSIVKQPPVDLLGGVALHY